MQIRRDIEREEWNAGLANGQILQTWEWGEVKRSQGWEPIRIAVEDNGKISAQISILKRKLPYIGKCIFYAPRGTINDFLLDAIRFEAKKHNAIALKIDPEIEEGDIKLINALKAQGFKLQKKQIQPRATFFIDLSHDLNTLLLSFEEKTRYNIRLAERKGVKVREISGQKGVDSFYNIYKETAGRDNFLIHPISYYQKIMSLMGLNGMARIFIAEYEGEPVAAVINFALGKRMWYMYGASKSSHRNVMPNHALHWEIIKRAKEEGFKLYDLWGIPSDPKPGHPLWGVYRFKKGFNGKLIKFVGCLDMVFDPLSYFLFDKGLVWFKNLRSLVLKGKISDSLGE
ncbi:MAG: peptidoglycan bridge formation glycyltransferase FemA/FemB family protein [Candidatus Margulisiibacteriota bacterium]